MPRSKYQRRHYTQIAELLRSVLADDASLFTSAEVSRLVDRFADLFAADNPRFQRNRFLTAIWPARTDDTVNASSRKVA